MNTPDKDGCSENVCDAENHAFHFEDLSDSEMISFMSEVQRVGKALRKVTGAVKINYEMHSNSGAHLHIHLFPRFG